MARADPPRPREYASPDPAATRPCIRSADIEEPGRIENKPSKIVSHPTVAVLGLYRGGTSCAAGVLDALGVHMGRRLMRGNRFNRRGYFEPIWLARRLRKMYDEPTLRNWMPREKRLAILRRWHRSQARRAARANRMLGAKHPLFCLAGEDLVEAWGEPLRMIAVYRPLDDCLGSLERTRWWRRRPRRAMLERMWNARERFLSGHDHLRLDYADLLANPEGEVRRMIDYLKLSPSPDQRDAAQNFIDPRLRHVSRGG